MLTVDDVDTDGMTGGTDRSETVEDTDAVTVDEADDALLAEVKIPQPAPKPDQVSTRRYLKLTTWL